MPTCEIELLGGFRVRIDGIAISSWPHRRAAEVVKLLALAERHRLHREQVMDALWPELAPDAAASNLRKAVHFARNVLGSDGSIASSGESLELWPKGDLSVDVAEFEAAALGALGDADPTACAVAAQRWTGELLPDDRYEIWSEEPRARLHLLVLEVLRCASLWERVLDVDPTDEAAHRALMQRALDAGDRRGVIRQFERLRDRLRADLGMGPDRVSIALYEKALAMEGEEPPSEAERIRAQLAWGLVHLNTGELDEAERTAEEARAHAIEANLGREMGEASAILGIVANIRGRWKELFRSEFIASVRRSPEIASFVFDAHLCLAEFCLYGPTPYEEIVAYAHELLDIAEEAHSVQGRALAELLLGEADLFSGRLDEAEDHLETAEQLHEQAGAPSGRIVAMQRLAEAAIARGRNWEAGRLLDRGLRLAESSALAPHLVVRMHEGLVESAKDNATAIERIGAADGDLAARDICPPCSMGFRVAASKTLARAGRTDQARRRLEEAERLAGMWPSGPWHAAVWEARAVLKRAEGDFEQAAAFFKEAAELFVAAGRPREEARCRAAAGA